MVPAPDRCVIVVGGDTPTQTTLRFLLEEEGCAAHTLPFPFDHSMAATPHIYVMGIVVIEQPHDGALRALTSLRRSAPHLPVIALARDANRALRQRVFALGVVDIIDLPVHLHELHTRIHATLQRDDALCAGGLTLRMAAREIIDDMGWRASLTQREVAVLAMLMRRPGQAVGRHTLLDAVWGEVYEGDGNALEVYIGRLRAKLTRPAFAAPLRTVRGQGYLFEARARPRALAPAHHSKLLRVLVVTVGPPLANHDMIVRPVLTMLHAAGYTTVCARHTDAAAAAGRLQPDAILLVAITDDSAVDDAFAHLRRDPRTAGVPSIALVAPTNVHVHAIAAGADDFLLLPLRPEELALRMVRHVGLLVREKTGLSRQQDDASGPSALLISV